MTVTWSTADADEKAGRRVVVLTANYKTDAALREWAQQLGFDLGWGHSGWPQHSADFGFHVTLVASANKVALPIGSRMLDTVALTATGFEVLGENTPVLSIAADDKLSALRKFFVETFGVAPTYPEFKPHVSLSYKWGGEPQLAALPPPPFALEFDWLTVAELADEPATMKQGDAAVQVFTVTDRATLSGTRKTRDGYLVADARVARTGIQEYAGFEVGKPDVPLVRVYRPADEVFSRGALASYAFRPVTMGHPAEGVTADNWRKETVGTTGGEIARDGEFVRVPLSIMDAGAIAEVEAGVREVSMGYECRLDWTPGVTADGQEFDAVQRGLRMNHLAVVEKGRAGSACRIGDGGFRAADKPESNMPKMMLDGVEYEMPEQTVQAVKKLSDKAAKLETDLAEAVTARDAAVKACDVAAGERDTLKSQVLTADQLDKLTADRVALIGAAVKLCPGEKFDGMTTDAIRAHVVKSKLGDSYVKDRSADYVAAVFDTLGSKTGDPVADALKSPTMTGDSSAAVSARDACLAEQRNAWAK